jgi:serine/threonine protein kinase
MLAGFDIAKVLNDSEQARLTQAGMIVGTAAYIAPEQAFGLSVDGRTDVYSAGIVLYELLTGRVPFEADTIEGTLQKQAYELPPAPRSINPNLPGDVEPMLAKALAKEPGRRYQTAAEMAAAAEEVATALTATRSGDPLTDLYKLGVEAFGQGRWDEAIGHLSRLITLDPDFEDAAHLLEAAMDARSDAAPGSQPAGANPRS